MLVVAEDAELKSELLAERMLLTTAWLVEDADVDKDDDAVVVSGTSTDEDEALLDSP